MEKRQVQIKGNNEKVLSVSLSDLIRILGDKSSMYWSLININDAVWDANKFGSILDFEVLVDNSENGLFMSWGEVAEISARFYRVVDLLLIGDNNQSKLRRHSTEQEYFKSCDISIELIDSSFWIVSAGIEDIHNLESKLPGVDLYFK